MKRLLLLLLCVFSLFTLSVVVMAAGEPAVITEDEFLALTNGKYLCHYNERTAADFDSLVSSVSVDGLNGFWDADHPVDLFLNGSDVCFYYDDALWMLSESQGLVQSELFDPESEFTYYQTKVSDFITFVEGFLIFVIVVVLAYFCYKFLRMFF